MSTTVHRRTPVPLRRAVVAVAATAAIAGASATTVAVIVDHAQIDMSFSGSTEAGPALSAHAGGQ